MKRYNRGVVGRPATRSVRVKYPEFAERLQMIAAKRGMVRRDFVKPHSSMNDATFNNYWHGYRIPPAKHAGAIARLLGVTLGYLLEGYEDEAPKIIEVPPPEILSRDEKEILRRVLDKLSIPPK